MTESALLILTLLVAVQHLGFMVLEMFLWQHPAGRRVFHTSAEKAAVTATLAANQGLYNGFLGVGLLVAIGLGNSQMQGYLLVCVLVAGLYGGWSVSRNIMWLQGLPALLALVLLLLA